MPRPKPKTILIDLDGIVVNLHRPWLAIYNELYHDTLTEEAWTDWEVSSAKNRHGFFKVLDSPGMFLLPDPIPGAIKGIGELIALKHNVYILSAATGNPLTDKSKWISRWMPWFDHKKVIFTHAKHLVKGDVLFDDGPHNILSYRAAWPTSHIATIEYPYNTAALKSAVVLGHWKDPVTAWGNFVEWVGSLP
jgi:5'-nucleotidase